MNRRNFILSTGSIGAATIGGAALLSGSAAASLDGKLSLDDPQAVSVDDGSYEYVSTALASVFEYVGFESPATEVSFTTEIDLDGEGDGTHELYNQTIGLDALASGDRGGSLDWSTGTGTTGVVHIGVGNAEPLTGFDFKREADHGGLDESPLTPQSPDSRWPVLAHPKYGPDGEHEGELYGVPNPLFTTVPEEETDGEEKTTTVNYYKTIEVTNGSESAEEVLQDSFGVTIDNIPRGSEIAAEGNATIETNSSKTA